MALRFNFRSMQIVLLVAFVATNIAPAVDAAIVRGPYLQNATPTSITIHWRTDTASDSRVEYGAAVDALANAVTDSEVTTEHRVELTGLSPGSQYFYAVGSTAGREAGNDAEHFFKASPSIGSSTPTRIWALGDAGRTSLAQLDVRDAYLGLDGTHTDVVLFLGDNAYGSGTDEQYQNSIFDVYPEVLRQSPSWSTRGNHENDEAAYFGIFEHPTAGEAGGVASGTESYYSFDFGDIHFVCMDSFASPRIPGSAQFLWLESDLASTTQRWIIAFWHHPPYSFGDHNSNTEAGMRQLRENAVPLLEQYGVDLVLTGHNHFFSRSLLINGHYGTSDTFDAATHVVDSGDGIETGDGAYNKGESPEGGVYVVAGSASIDESTGAVHPTSYIELRRSGSYVIDIDGDRLDARFVDRDGEVADHVTILKTPPQNEAPVINAGPDREVELDDTFEPSATAIDDGLPDPPGALSFQWLELGATTPAQITGAASLIPQITFPEVGTYEFRLTATDGELGRADDVTVEVTASVPPATPTGLSASAGDGVVDLDWADNVEGDLTGYDVLRSTASGSGFELQSNVSASQYSDTTVTNGTTYYYVIRARDAGSEPSPNSEQASATPVNDVTPPSAPTGLDAVAGDQLVQLDWADNAEADLASYSVKRSTQPGGPYSEIAIDVLLSEYDDATVTNGTTYYYTVIALDDSDNPSADADEVSATPQASINEAPTVEITAPVNGARFLAGGQVEINATASDPDGSIASVEFYADGVSVGVEIESPYMASMLFQGNAMVELTAVATDDAGAETTSAPVLIPEPAAWLLQACAVVSVAVLRRRTRDGILSRHTRITMRSSGGQMSRPFVIGCALVASIALSNPLAAELETISPATARSEVATSQGIVVVDLYAEW